MEMYLTLKLSVYEVSSHFYGAKFLRVLMNNWDWVFLLQVQVIFTKFYTTIFTGLLYQFSNTAASWKCVK